jgi:hypothetical protein
MSNWNKQKALYQTRSYQALENNVKYLSLVLSTEVNVIERSNEIVCYLK